MGKKVEYKRDKHEVSDATTPWDIVLEAVRQGYKLTIQNISAEDEDTAFTELRFGYKTQQDIFHWWVAQESPQAGVLYWMDQAKKLTEGMHLVIRFTGTTNTNNLKAYVDGYEEKVS